MFPNIKKVKILTPIISMRPCKAIQVYTTITPLQFCFFIQLCDQHWKTEWHVSGWKISPVYKNQKPNNMQASCYFVSASHFTNLLF